MLSTRLSLRSWVQKASYPPSHTAWKFTRRPETTLSHTQTEPERSTAGANFPQDSKVEGWFFLDSVFPIRLGTWDLRYYIALFQEASLLEKLHDIFKDVHVHGFEVHNVDPRIKDGGVFVNFRYVPTPTSSSESSESTDAPKAATDPPNPALIEIEETLLRNIAVKGGFPSWLGLKHGNLWRVRGNPWREDMRRYASPILRVAFEGPDVGDERIWGILRPYGRIRDLKPSGPVPAGTLRSATVTFERIAAATIAHNCVHGAYVPPSATNSGTLTRLVTAYERPIKPHLIRQWLASHPKIVFPIVVFLLGTLTYTIFDPIRAVAVQAKVMDWFDYRQFALTKWLRRNTLDRLTMGFNRPPNEDSGGTTDTTVWKDRQEAESTLNNYLSDFPSTITFVHGPAGSGKSRLLRSVLEKSDRRAVVIDCTEIYAGGTDSAMVTSLAEQTGYWPIFTFLNSVNNMIDLASVGLIGQKAGLSSSLEAQVSQVLEVVGQGLRRVSSSRRKEAEHRIKRAQNEERKAIFDAERRERIRLGVWHDGRVDCIAGNGAMSELGVGIERFGVNDEDARQERDEDAEMLAKPELNEKVRREREYRNVQDVGALPVVVIKNFAPKAGKEEVSNALADWAAGLVSSHVAHVIVVSDNRENAKRLAKALPTKPLSAVALADADPASSLSYVNHKLYEVGEHKITYEETQLIQRLGGRASDLETLIHKVRAGQGVAEAVEDIIQRGVAELRKNAFGDDSEDAKGLAWTRQQAWTVLKLLAQKDKLQYYQVLLDFPFKGDEPALRSMEHAELISITTIDGRPSTIRPGKPIHRHVFQRLLADRVFQATQDIACNELLISSAESVIKAAESELVMLKDVVSGPWDRGSGTKKANCRARYLMDKMQDALKKVEQLEKENAELKKTLATEQDEEEEGQGKRWWLFG